MNKIKEYLDQASIAYYSGSPIVSDEVFDHLADQIGYTKVGAKQHEKLCKHFAPMYSLQKYYEDEGAQPLAEYKDKVSSVKLDGAAISLLYIEGVLVQALTRGDGIEGTNITDKMYARKDLVPLSIPTKAVIQITGEIVAPKQVQNSRNVAAGSLSLKDTNEFCTRPISFFAYSIFPYVEDTYRKDMKYVSYLGFETIFAQGLIDVYECDGVVHRIDSNYLFDSLGYTARHPRGSFALKVRKEAVETELLGVEWSAGKTGKITPVGLLRPVYIGDKLISRCTLNNPGYIEALELYIGCTVTVLLGGEVIPKLVSRVH